MMWQGNEEYLALLRAWPREKAALVTDERVYTYGQLYEEAAHLRENVSLEQEYVLIHEQTIARQLLAFLAYSGTRTRPIIATEASRGQEFVVDAVPPKACMGVLTSGSTGRSKLLWRDYNSWADFFPEQNRVFGITETTVIFCQGSLAFTGNLSIYLGVLAAGGTLVVTERFRPKHWLELLDRWQVNALYLIPSKLMLLPKLMRQPNFLVRTIVSGSQSVGRQEADRLLACFPRAELTLYYGASELNYITYIRGEEMTEDQTLVGRPFEGVRLSIKHEEIFIDTPYHVEGVSLPYSLKDRGRIDEQGRLHFLGRTDDICNVNGIKVSCKRIASALERLPAVEQAVVLGRHEADADVLTAYLVTQRKYGKQELLSLLRHSLESYEMPKRFVLLAELPLNESGKPDLCRLRELGERG